MTERDNGKDLGLRRKLSLPNHDILEAILAERGPFVDDAEEAECKVREVGEQMVPVPFVGHVVSISSHERENPNANYYCHTKNSAWWWSV